MDKCDLGISDFISEQIVGDMICQDVCVISGFILNCVCQSKC